jgi:RNA polymerase sigma factor (sigma-70 family)
MATETVNAAASSDQASSPATAHRARQYRRGKQASRRPRTPGRKDANPASNYPSVADLVASARRGDKRAWEELVERYAPLIWSICRRYGLAGADAEDVVQDIWLHLVEQLNNLRDPNALPGWLVTTTTRACIRARRTLCTLPADEQVLENMPDERDLPTEYELIVAERDAALREAFARMPLECQQLLALLIADPPVPYTEISARLGIPVGSIGPTRRRYLDKLRRDPAMVRLISAETAER